MEKNKYNRICDNCKKPYIGYGEKFCSLACIWKGKKHSEKTLKKMKETQNLGQFKKGHVSPMKGEKSSYSGIIHASYGIERTPEVKKKISNTRIKKQLGKGKKNGNWKGGITELKVAIRSSVEYRKKRKEVFMRDFYTCQNCGDNKGGNLEMHHKKPFSVIFKENNLKTWAEVIICEELWDIDNCITLCQECHKRTDSYGHPSKYNRTMLK